MFILKNFQAHSGMILPFKIECDSLTTDDWDCLAWIISTVAGNFGAVEGVPNGGLNLATSLDKYATTGPVLIVDDVFTTGASMEAQRRGRHTKGAVVFARTTPPDWIQALFLLNTRSTK